MPTAHMSTDGCEALSTLTTIVIDEIRILEHCSRPESYAGSEFDDRNVTSWSSDDVSISFGSGTTVLPPSISQPRKKIVSWLFKHIYDVIFVFSGQFWSRNISQNVTFLHISLFSEKAIIYRINFRFPLRPFFSGLQDLELKIRLVSRSSIGFRDSGCQLRLRMEMWRRRIF